MKKKYVINVEDQQTFEEVLEDGRYNWISDCIDELSFPMRPRKSGKVKIEFIDGDEFDHEPKSFEIIDEAKRRGLKRPIHEDALLFGGQYPEVQKDQPLIFLHKPVLAVVAVKLGGEVVKEPIVLCLSIHGGDVDGRILTVMPFDYRWPRNYRFGFVRR